MEQPASLAKNSVDDKVMSLVSDLLAEANVRLNGNRPWDIQLHDPSALQQVLAYGSLGLGESYMRGAWDSERLDQTLTQILKARLDEKIKPSRLLLYSLKARLLNRQTKDKAWEVGEAHYDLGNTFYQAMLDDSMAYTCGYWREADNLHDAQQAKLDLICRKLDLQPGQKVLDIGCGWGSFMRYAAEHYGVECVGLTISREQVALGEQLCAGLPVSFRLQDYRDVDELFDRIVSVGMFEHVGHHNYRTYMSVAHRCLKPDGLFLLHTIGRLRSKSTPDPWLDKYIFPNGELPTMGWIDQAAEGLFVTEDVHNFGADYDHTLMAWHENFEAAWPELKASADHSGLDEQFYRMWRYYLLSCAATFRARITQVWQYVFSPAGVPGGYRRVS